MRVSMEWLSQYVNIDGIRVEEIAEKLTQAGVEVDTVEKRDTGIRDVVVGYVLSAEQHPNADKLKVCRVDVGEDRPVDIVCGAPNVAAGQYVPVAKVGATLPDFKIKKAKLRGVESNGMICSASELGLDKKMSDGIMVLNGKWEPGTDVKSVLGMNDEVLELDLTPNRSDCLSIIGVAYEVAALFDRELNIRYSEPLQGEAELPAKVELDAGEDCTLYTLQVVRNIQIAPSPQWMQNRLIASGIRPINNVVDITNYVMLEYGQPLHAFDYDKVADGTIVVRHARKGETFVTLDNVERALDESMMLITDGSKPIGIAGVMGGANSEISDSTRTVLIESAYFSPQSIGRTSRKLGLRSEASARFEKSVDPARVLPALRRAAQLMCELGGGEAASEEVVAEKGKHAPSTVSMRYERMNQLIGVDIDKQEVTSIFDRLRFDYDDKGEQIEVHVPTRRPDISIEADLIEEVARLFGYERIPVRLPTSETEIGSLTKVQSLKRMLRRTMQGLGLFEVMTYAFTAPHKNREVESLNAGMREIRLQMPMSEERSVLRTSLLPGLLEVAQYNIHRREERVAIFELGRTFATEEAELSKLPQEEEEFAGLLCGPFMSPDWLEQEKPLDFFTVKGLLEALFQRLGIGGIAYEQASPEGFHPGRTAEVKLDGEGIGYVGQLHPQLAAQYDLPESYAFQVKLSPVLQAAVENEVRYRPLPRFPAVTRDLAVVVDEDVPVRALEDTICDVAKRWLESVTVFDVFTGEKIGKGKKSVALALVFRDPNRTLTDAEINEMHDQIVRQLHDKHGAQLR